MGYKIIVAHPGRQHSFRLASALKKNGMLLKYITTVYDRENSLLMKIVKFFLSGDNLSRAKGRKNPDLKDTDVKQFGQIRGLVEIFLAHYDKKKKFYNWWQEKTADYFGRKVAYYAIRNKADAVIMYDTNALTCFDILKNNAPEIFRIMDISAANRIYMKKVYESDMKKNEKFAEKLKVERFFLWDKKIVARLEKELALTQFFLAPSAFVKESLEFSNIGSRQIKICPYGSNFVISKNNRLPNRRIEAIYVGNLTAMKGIGYLLDAALEIQLNELRLTVVGTYDNSTHIFDRYMDHIRFTGRVPHEKVKRMLLESDIFVFPSLGEGLSLSILEAMACGLPCIVTRNSGVAIKDSVEGFVIDIQNKQAIKEKLMWFIHNKEEIPKMGKAAQKLAMYYNWGNYEKKVTVALQEILSERLVN